jgi:hypothetical protein
LFPRFSNQFDGNLVGRRSNNPAARIAFLARKTRTDHTSRAQIKPRTLSFRCQITFCQMTHALNARICLHRRKDQRRSYRVCTQDSSRSNLAGYPPAQDRRPQNVSRSSSPSLITDNRFRTQADHRANVQSGGPNTALRHNTFAYLSIACAKNRAKAHSSQVLAHRALGWLSPAAARVISSSSVHPVYKSVSCRLCSV